jgi:hypothetical protein
VFEFVLCHSKSFDAQRLAVRPANTAHREARRSLPVRTSKGLDLFISCQ